MRRYRGGANFSRSRQVVLTDRDELAFSRVVREFCPDVIIVGDADETGSRLSWVLGSAAHAFGADVSFLLPSSGQESEWHFNKSRGPLVVRPLVRFGLTRSKWEWVDPTKKRAFNQPVLGAAEISVLFPRFDDDLKRFAQKHLRLANKVLHDGHFGRDACLWSQAGAAKGERRGLGGARCVAPDHAIKLNKYYDGSLWDDRLPEVPWSRETDVTHAIKRRYGLEKCRQYSFHDR